MIEIIAHRGASRDHRENTLAAFAAALEQGADGIELDVHATRDGRVVVHHDPMFSEAREAPARAISRISLAELGAARLPDAGGIPTLDQVLELVGHRATVYVEVKASGIERQVAACLGRHAAARVAVHAFDHRIPVAIRALVPRLDIGFLSASYPLDVASLLRDALPNAFWQHADLIDAALVAAAHAFGARVVAWTENDPVHARSLIAMGVDALCTDTPGFLRSGLAG
ncbi:MAG: glycerophosphodiester phosphodiesterase [Gemmatimonas sp.]